MCCVVDRIKHERIPLKRRARVYVGDSDEPTFEMHCLSRDLSISGIFLNTETLLRIGLDVKIDLEVHPEEWLALNGEVARRIEFNDREHAAGFAVAFGELSDRSHETLLRYFLTDKVVAFYQIFLKRFPHLRDELSEQDAALIVNLWEDNRHALVEESHNAPITTPPRIFELPGGGMREKPVARPSAKAPLARPAPVAKAVPAKVATVPAKVTTPAAKIAVPAKLAAPAAKVVAKPTFVAAKAPVPSASKLPVPAKPAVPLAKAAPSKAPAAKPAAKVSAPAPVKKRSKR